MKETERGIEEKRRTQKVEARKERNERRRKRRRKQRRTEALDGT